MPDKKLDMIGLDSELNKAIKAVEAEKEAATKNRDSRESEERVETTRERTGVREWQQPSNLSLPPPPEGYRWRWVRHEVIGSDDTKNVVTSLREGYQPVYGDELPDYFFHQTLDKGNQTGVVRVGDLILTKIPDETAGQREDFYKKRAKRLEASVNAELMENDSDLMPIMNESMSHVTRGRRPTHFEQEE